MQKILKPSNELKFKTPTNSLCAWEGALPIGNGKIGALVQGGVKKERIMLSDVRAMHKGTVGVLPDVSDKLKEVRSFVASKNPVMAGVTLNKAFVNKKYQPEPFVPYPVADLIIEQVVEGNISNYSKTLSLESGEACVQFTNRQTKFERACFVSYENDYLFLELNKVGTAPIVASFAIAPHDRKTAIFNEKIESEFENEKVVLSGAILGYEVEVNGMTFGAMARIMVDSKAVIEVTDKRLRVENAEKILVVVKTYSAKVKEKFGDKVRTELLNLRQIGYEKAFKSHLMIFQKNAIKTEVKFPKIKDASIEELRSDFDFGNIQLYEKLFNFGKYLFQTGIPFSVGQPLVSGVWNKHYNNSLQVAKLSTTLSSLYSSAFMFNKEEYVFEVLSYYLKYQDDLKKSAFRVYKSRGYMIPETFVFGSGLPASIEPSSLSTITGGAVLANLFYDYFLYTKDIKFLKNDALPFMTNVADFYLNYFYKNDKGDVVSCPSFAPDGKSKFFENRDIGVYENSTADFVCVRALFNNIMNVANIYSLNVEKIVEYTNFLNSLPQLPLEKNAIKEYKNEDNSALSSGVMHLYSVFGTKDVQHYSNQSSMSPYINSVIYKVDKALESQNINSVGRLAQTAVNLGLADEGAKVLKHMVRNFLSDNLMFMNADKFNQNGEDFNDNYFNLVGNMLFCTNILESVVLSFGNNISIMPAKNPEWKEGGVCGVHTKQNVVVDVDFDDKRGNLNVNLKALRATKFSLILPKGVKKVKGYSIDPSNPRIDNITLSAGKSLAFDVKY